MGGHMTQCPTLHYCSSNAGYRRESLRREHVERITERTRKSSRGVCMRMRITISGFGVCAEQSCAAGQDGS
eukprot:2215699-Rhodomonas_salina.2